MTPRRGHVGYEWRGMFGNDELNALHPEAFSHRLLEDDWWAQVNQHSLGWVCARAGDELVGWVNVTWLPRSEWFTRSGKAAVIGITRQMACDFGPDGIRVNAICPGHSISE
jgi:NAD(P)-dependent dehydrogenase (short-subunit alcohol dehydrogenase family)